MNKKILNSDSPECSVKGHRIHTTMNITMECWPEWGRISLGIAGGFIHFESEKDYETWRELHQTKIETPKVEVLDEEEEEYGRCVAECGPIGFKAA